MDTYIMTTISEWKFTFIFTYELDSSTYVHMYVCD